jgi:omega-amidase
MKEDLKVVTIQTKLFWENIGKNIAKFDWMIDELPNDIDLILLPEMFNTGFSQYTVLAEKMDGRSVNFLLKKSKEKNAAIMATLMIREGDKIFNRLVCVKPEGSIETYDKRHLFCLSDETLLDKGVKNTIIDIKGWKIMPQICYDLRFPIWSRNEYKNEEFKYDVLIYLANWPKERKYHWLTLLSARAIENQSYVIGVNRVGIDGRDIDHSGDSMVVNFKGIPKDLCIPTKEIMYSTLEYLPLEKYRKDLPIYKDWDNFEIK